MQLPTLTVWGANEKQCSGLPSLDPSSLIALAYIRFAKAADKVKIQNIALPYMKGAPCLNNGVSQIEDIPLIVDELRRQGVNCDAGLDSVQSADALAVCSMLQHSLRPAVLHELWQNSDVFGTLTRPYVASQLYFPFGLLVPGRLHAQRTADLRAPHTGMSELASDRVIQDKGKECLTWLDKKVAESKYFMTNSPSVVDAIVFGYLAPLSRVTSGGSPLVTHFRSCVQLRRWLQDVLQQYFPTAVSDYAGAGDANVATSAFNDYPHRNRNLVVAALGAVLLTALYMLGAGMIQLQVADKEQDDE